MNFQEYKTKQEAIVNNVKYEHEEDKNRRFVWDGVVAVNEEEFALWQNAPVKIMFLLKEPYGEYDPENPTDISGRMRLNIARWKFLITELYQTNAIPEFPNNEGLRGVNTGMAIVEIKKYDENFKRSTADDIMYYAKRDKEFLQEQIELINPEVILCCGTYDQYAHGIYENDKTIEHLLYLDWQEEAGGDASVFKHGNRAVVHFYHPAYAKSPEDLYNLLGALFVKSNAFSLIGKHSN